MLRARWRLMMALAAWALVSVLGQSVEDALVAIGDLQLIEREVGRLDAHLHAADLRAAAQRSCLCEEVHSRTSRRFALLFGSPKTPSGAFGQDQ